MRTPRFFVAQDLKAGDEITLPAKVAHHLIHVLRIKSGQELTLFNGRGGEIRATLKQVGRGQACVALGAFSENNRESPLETRLGLAVTKRNAMDAALSRATEMGVTHVTPLLTTNCAVRQNHLPTEHWQRIVQSSCEQCGRNVLPDLAPVSTLTNWLAAERADVSLVSNPDSKQLIANISQESASEAMNVVPERVLTPDEIAEAEAAGFDSVCLGKRILRAETAPAALLALVQQRWGDL